MISYIVFFKEHKLLIRCINVKINVLLSYINWFIRVFAEIVDTFATLVNVTHGPCAGVGNLWAEVNYGNWALLWPLGVIMAAQQG